MRSGGGLVVSPAHCTHAVDIDHAACDVREQLRRVEPPESLLRDEQRLLDHCCRVSTFLKRLARAVRSRTVAKGESTGLGTLLQSR